MAGVEGMMPTSYYSPLVRHAEFVSASIVMNALRVRSELGGAVSLRHSDPVQAEKWTLKRVQGDRIFESFAWCLS
jgi:hypothetical protein